MTHEQLKALQPGDLVCHKSNRTQVYVVTGNYGDRVTAVRSVDVTNEIEWERVDPPAMEDDTSQARIRQLEAAIQSAASKADDLAGELRQH
jgi:hypothetical protein